VNKRRSAIWRVAAISVLAVAAAAALDWSGLLDHLDRKIYDSFLSLRNRSESANSLSERVSVVAVTNADVTRLNQPFPWPRDEQSVIFEKISELKPSVVAVDLLYPEPTSPEADGRLAFQLAACGKVVTAFYFDDAEDRAAAGDAELLNASGDRLAAEFSEGDWLAFEKPPALPTTAIAAGISRAGHAHSISDPDGLIRRVPLVVRDHERFYPSLSLQAALMHWGVDWSQMTLSANSLKIVDVPNLGTVEIPLDTKGRMLLNYPRSSANRFPATNVFSLMDAAAPSAEGQIVCVGSLVTGHGDVYATPVNPVTPGLLINALAIDQILSGEFITEAKTLMSYGLAVLFGLITAGLIWLARPIVGGILCVLVIAAGGWLCFWLFGEFKLWLAPGSAMISAVFSASLMSLDHYVFVVRRHQQTVNAFSRYLGPNLGEILAENPNAFDSGPKRRLLTVFFSDIVAYTSTSESLESEDLIGMLNRYFDRMAVIAFSHHATVSKYMGDGMMVFFNEPVEQSDHAARGVRMAISMQEAMPKLNEEFKNQGLPPLSVRMGLNTGYAHVGNIGSAGFSDFTIIGPAVNLAARVMGEAGGGQIFVGSKTHALVEGEFEFESLGKRELKGVREPEALFLIHSESL
jgi:adenylate cyclase